MNKWPPPMKRNKRKGLVELALCFSPEPEPSVESQLTALKIRTACKNRHPLGGVDAQMLEHALTMTERERNELDGEKEGLLAKVAEAWAERDRLRELYIISKNEAMRLEIERNALQSFVDDDVMFGKVIAENRELRAKCNQLWKEKP